MKVQQGLLAGLGIVLTLVLFWFLLYSPTADRIADATEATLAAEQQQDVARGRIRALEAARTNAPDAEASLATVRAIIPEDTGMPGALRQLQDAADAAGVTILGVLPDAGAPATVDPALTETSVGVQAEGSYFQVVDFLRRLEDPRLTSRAMIGEFLVVRLEDHPTLTVDLQLRLFSLEPVSPGAAAAVVGPAATADEVDAPDGVEDPDQADVEAMGAPR